MKLINRITIDLDTKDINILIKCLKILKRYHFTTDLSVKASPTNKGFHLVAWAKKGVTLKKLLKIRRKAGDDKIRIFLDAKSNRAINVLFSKKKKRKLNKEEHPIEFDGIPMQYETKGSEENVKISIGET